MNNEQVKEFDNEFDNNKHRFLSSNEEKELIDIKNEYLSINDQISYDVLRFNNIIMLISNIIFFSLLFNYVLNDYVIIKFLLMFFNVFITIKVISININYFKIKKTIEELDSAINGDTYFLKE
jgi:hypothetical protein